jgi:flavin reductase (DIM6/NTAB) family NADH-FMN oxidoreductase RutF
LPPGLVGPIPDGRDPQSYDRLRRRVLWSIANGLYLLGSRAGERRNLMTASFVTQVATSPKLVAVAVEVGSVTHGLVDESGVFALTVLPRQARLVIRHFVKPVTELSVDADSGAGTMQGEAVVAAPSGAPVLAAAGAWLDCAVRHRLVLGSHTLFVGEVTDCGFGRPDAPEVPEHTDVEAELLRMEDTRMHYGG